LHRNRFQFYKSGAKVLYFLGSCNCLSKKRSDTPYI